MSRGVSVEILNKLKNHQKNLIRKRRSQLDRYVENLSDRDILYYVSLPGPTFGYCMEDITRELFNLEVRKSSSHDHVKNGKTIEQKSARYCSNGILDFRWQHIEMKHEWDLLLCTALDFNRILYYVTTRENVQKLISEKIITGQGKKNSDGIKQPQQAFWFCLSDFKKVNKDINDYFCCIATENDLVSYINSC